VLSFPLSAIEHASAETECLLLKRQQEAGPRCIGQAMQRLFPFSRRVFFQQQRTKPTSETQQQSSSSSHFVRVQVRGALAGKARDVAASDAQPPVSIWFSFCSRADSSAVLSAITRGRRYHSSLLVSTHIHAMLENARRLPRNRSSSSASSPPPRGEGLRSQGDRSEFTPPFPPRPSDLPPACQLPQVVANELGEVFWIKASAPSSRPKSPAAVAPPPQRSPPLAASRFVQPLPPGVYDDDSTPPHPADQESPLPLGAAGPGADDDALDTDDSPDDPASRLSFEEKEAAQSPVVSSPGIVDADQDSKDHGVLLSAATPDAQMRIHYATCIELV